MNAKRILMSLSLLFLLLAAAGTASALPGPFKSGTYYYTDEYFHETFGEVKQAPSNTYIVKGSMVYVDSKAFAKKFGKVAVAQPPSATELPLEPGETPSNETGEEPELVVVPVKEGNVTNETIAVTNETIVPSAGNETTAGLEIVVTGEEPGNATGDIVVAPVAKGNEAGNKSLSAAPAAVGGGVPMQLVILGFLIIVIVIMLAILLTREEKQPSDKGRAPRKSRAGRKPERKKEAKSKEGKLKGDWQEGAFFKEAKEKKEKKEKAKKEGAKKEAAAEKSDTKEVKPFLLKIKDEG